MARPPVGYEGALYRQDNDTAGTWLLVENVRDLTRNQTVGESDATTRANNGWNATVTTLKDLSLDFSMVYDDADDDISAFEDAFLTNTQIRMRALSKVSGNGVEATFAVTSFTKNEELGEVQSVDVTLRVGYDPDNSPIAVVAGAPVSSSSGS